MRREDDGVLDSRLGLSSEGGESAEASDQRHGCPFILSLHIHTHLNTPNTDNAYAQKLILTAKSLFDLAYQHQGKFTTSNPFYSSSGYQDELAWAAAWCVLCCCC